MDKKLPKEIKKLKRPLCNNKFSFSNVNPSDIICSENGEGVLQTNNIGNKLFRYLIYQRCKSYDKTDDSGKFLEVWKITRVMSNLFPSCRFMVRSKNGEIFKEISWEEGLEKTIQSFCDSSYSDVLTASETQYFNSILQNSFKEESILTELSEVIKPDIIDCSDDKIADDVLSFFNVNDCHLDDGNRESMLLNWDEWPSDSKVTPDIPISSLEDYLFETNVISDGSEASLSDEYWPKLTA